MSDEEKREVSSSPFVLTELDNSAKGNEKTLLRCAIEESAQVAQTIGAVLGISTTICVSLWGLTVLSETFSIDSMVIACLVISVIAGICTCLFGKISDVIRSVNFVILCIVAATTPFVVLTLILDVFDPVIAAILLLVLLLLFAIRCTGKMRVFGIVIILITLILLVLYEWAVPHPCISSEAKLLQLRIAAEQGDEDAINLLWKLEEKQSQQ